MQWFYYFIFFKVLGWRMLGEPPQDVKKYLFVVLPHTSNWDFFYGWLASRAIGIDAKFFVKNVFFVWPIVYVCRWLGLKPVNRDKRTNFVDSMAAEFERADQLHMLIAPEGTRAYVDNLRSGYYYLAQQAGVPIVVGGPNYAEKTFTLMPPREPAASFAQDQQNIIEFARAQLGLKPQNSFR